MSGLLTLLVTWALVQRTGAMQGVPSWAAWTVAAGFLLATPLPALLLILHREHRALLLSKNQRVLALGAAIVTTIVAASRSIGWLPSLKPYLRAMSHIGWSVGDASLLTAAKDPRTLGHIVSFVNSVSSIALVLVLIAFFRERPDKSQEHVKPSRLLNIAITATLIACGLQLAYSIVRFFAAPYYYFQFYDIVERRGLTFGAAMRTPIRDLLDAAAVFVVPYVAWKVRRKRRIQPRPVPGIVEL